MHTNKNNINVYPRPSYCPASHLPSLRFFTTQRSRRLTHEKRTPTQTLVDNVFFVFCVCPVSGIKRIARFTGILAQNTCARISHEINGDSIFLFPNQRARARQTMIDVCAASALKNQCHESFSLFECVLYSQTNTSQIILQ